MVCINYKFGYNKEVQQVQKSIVYVELYCTDTPNPLPTNAVGVEGFPDNFDRANVVFEAGSTLYVVNTKKVYIADETGTFVVQN
jgi:hypothetical protein